MNTFRGAFSLASMLVSAAAVFPAGAGAADLYGGHGYAPMPVSSPAPSWYFRLDGGYSAFDDPKMVENGVYTLTDTEIDGAWSLGGGVGYYFTRNIRADITYEKRFESEARGTLRDRATGIAGTREFGLDTNLVMFNAYYDFDTRSFFTPYIGVGLGIAHHETKDGTVALAGGGTGNIAGESTTEAAGALMAGASVALLGGVRRSGSIKDAAVETGNLYLDVGYRFLYLGETTTGPLEANNVTSNDPTVEQIHAHEVRFGLRYDFR